jgi:hypothetical protein
MSCDFVKLPGGSAAIVCRSHTSSRHCSVCKRALKTWKLCDFPTGNGKTCDKPLCQACAHHCELDLDYCPNHARLLTPEGRLKL